MPAVAKFQPWRRWLNSARPRILLWYFLLTAFSSITSILVTHHILYEQIDDQSQEYASHQLRLFQQQVQNQRTASSPKQQSPKQQSPKQQSSEQQSSEQLLSEQQTKALFDDFLSRYEPADGDDYAIALVQGQVYRYTDLLPNEFLSQESALIQYWAGLNRTSKGSANFSTGKLYYIAEPVFVNGQKQGVLVIVHCADQIYQIVDGAILLIIPATLGVIALAAAIAWATAGRVLAPLRLLTQTACSITESDMTQRIAVEGTDEIAELTITFNDMLDRLQTAFESQQEFIKDAGHELRTPITIIRGYLETLKYRPDRQEQTIMLAIDELDRMNRLVNDLLLLAKSERPDFLRLNSEALDWLTEELYLKVRSLANRQWKLESKGLSSVQVDRQRITQAVMNLVQNAIRHTEQGDAITLGSSVRENQAHIWVSDTGDGIAPEDQTRIFERFARATSRQTQDEHYGLGLAIVQAIAQAHGGWVELSSQLGQGSTFTIVIPLETTPDRAIHESNSHYRGQSSYHRLLGVRATGTRLPDHRR
jgi:signal transduction histidine kinase